MVQVSLQNKNGRANERWIEQVIENVYFPDLLPVNLLHRDAKLIRSDPDVVYGFSAEITFNLNEIFQGGIRPL